MAYDIITIGGATIDITFLPKEGTVIDNQKDILRQKLLAFEYGAKINIAKSDRSFGGGAANAAVSFSRFGFKTAAIAAIGDDGFGKEIIVNFKSQKVKTDMLQKIKGKSTDLAFVIVGPGSEHVIFIDNKAKNYLEITAKNIKSIKNAKWIYLVSLGDNWEKKLDKIFAAGTKTKIAWNPGQAQLSAGASALKKFLRQTEVLMLNLDEAIQLVISDIDYAKKDAAFLNDPENLFPIIKNFGAKIIVITCGKDGAWAYDGNEIYYTPIQKEKRRADTTGVGDSFNSAFVAGLELFKGDIKRAMKLGIANAASNIAETGAQSGLLSKKDLKKLNI